MRNCSRGRSRMAVIRDEPNKIVHFSAWTSIADAKAFFESPRLVKIRQEAGVKAPEFIYLEQIESGAF